MGEILQRKNKKKVLVNKNREYTKRQEGRKERESLYKYIYPTVEVKEDQVRVELVETSLKEKYDHITHI